MMELPVSEEGEMPIPLNSTFGGHGHMIHHNNYIIIPSEEHNVSSNNFKKTVKYKECLKNHAASMGGNATDGCGEFMPSGEEGTLEALTCSACNCHRNFHRKEIDGDDISSLNPRIGRRVFLGNHNYHKGYFGHDGLISSRPIAPHQMMMSCNNMGPSESDEQEDGGGVVGMVKPPTQMMMMKKRFRTKFSQEQKEKMMNFAEKVGWKIQKQEEGVVQQFCQEVGVKRRVLKVWIHNNKHTLAKKSIVDLDHQDSVA